MHVPMENSMPGVWYLKTPALFLLLCQKEQQKYWCGAVDALSEIPSVRGKRGEEEQMRGTMLGRITSRSRGQMTGYKIARRVNRIKAVSWPQRRSPEDWNERERNLNAACGPSSSYSRDQSQVAAQGNTAAPAMIGTREKSSSEAGRVKERRVINSEQDERSGNLLNGCCLRIDKKGKKRRKLKIGTRKESARKREPVERMLKLAGELTAHRVTDASSTSC